MNLRIYQVNNYRDDNDVRFMGYNFLVQLKERLNTDTVVDPSVYDEMFEAEVSCGSPEEVYTMFNVRRPEDFLGHSLSVSDVIEIQDSPTAENGFYFCDNIGFKKIDFDSSKCRISDRHNSKQRTLNILYVEVGQYPKMVETPDNLEALQRLVDGYIEPMYLDDGAVLICNEEAKIKRFPFNRVVFNDNGEMVEAIMGNFFITYNPPESENFASLPDDMAARYAEKFKYPENLVRGKFGEISAVKYEPTEVQPKKNKQKKEQQQER